MGRINRQKGATLVEAALVFPILILLIVATLELGLLFKDYLTLSYISREGARVGALAGNNAEADCAILRGIGSVANGDDLARLSSVQIFKADQDGNQGLTNQATYVPGNDPEICNVPSTAADGWTITTAWPPITRQTVIGSQDLDIIGVRVTLDRNWVTGFPPFRGPMVLDESTISRLEPRAFEND